MSLRLVEELGDNEESFWRSKDFRAQAEKFRRELGLDNSMDDSGLVEITEGTPSVVVRVLGADGEYVEMSPGEAAKHYAALEPKENGE
ncbi:hypothetical protein KJ632_02525 [Patescibacteria group bacterium]|nr:hypothetical protein [Patescibacteria group bacterium]